MTALLVYYFIFVIASLILGLIIFRIFDFTVYIIIKFLKNII